MRVFLKIAGLILILFSQNALADGRDIGEVSTAFKLIGPNHKIVISAFDDPKVKGITCYIARPKTGGIKGAVGIAEDPSLASVSCVQTGPIIFTGKISDAEKGEEVFDERRSIIFKSLNINRIYDKENGSMVYVARTHRVIEGSPTTSISVVAPMVWNGAEPQKPKLD
jgi:CreA protein